MPSEQLLPEPLRQLLAIWVAMGLDYHRTSDRLRAAERIPDALTNEARAEMLSWCSSELLAVAKRMSAPELAVSPNEHNSCHQDIEAAKRKIGALVNAAGSESFGDALYRIKKWAVVSPVGEEVEVAVSAIQERILPEQLMLNVAQRDPFYRKWLIERLTEMGDKQQTEPLKTFSYMKHLNAKLKTEMAAAPSLNQDAESVASTPADKCVLCGHGHDEPLLDGHCVVLVSNNQRHHHGSRHCGCKCEFSVR